ncbi:hypothetical protein QA601_08965 [Chitinispirillales bacterium ANBcel5]|uniref:alpha/beta hydrolase family protein n=1 Tax=Cellulosispirillum alkaliphilum TaxID=3039283 RepID=UPI002A541C6C|nr:hypothetical protein [Chitinispirillales bacterium ANBcel5]
MSVLNGHDLREAGLYLGPLDPIETGFGSRGPFKVNYQKISGVHEDNKDIHLFIPQKEGEEIAEEKYPVVFFSQGFAMSDPFIYDVFIDHIVSQGAVVVFVPHRNIFRLPGGPGNYEMLFDGYTKAVRKGISFIDTSRIGVVGRSFGGGAAPWLTYKMINEHGWGEDKAFMFIMAPWYFHKITDEQLASFPDHVKLHIQVYSDDKINDPAIASELFGTISIPEKNKLFSIVYSDTGKDYNGDFYIYSANHQVPKSNVDTRAVYDGYLYHAVIKQYHILFDSVMNQESEAMEILNTGLKNPKLCSMGVWPDGRAVRPIKVTRNPQLDKGSLSFYFPFTSILNPRR